MIYYIKTNDILILACNICFYCSLISAAYFSFCQENNRVFRVVWFTRCSRITVHCYWTENTKVSRSFLVITFSSLLLVLFLEPVQNCLKSITVLQPKLWRKQTAKDEQRRDNRPIILVPTCFCSSCLLSCRPGDSNLPTKSLTGPLVRESKHKNKESTFPAAGRSECWSSPEAIRSGQGLRAPIVSLYFGVWKARKRCCFFLLLLLHPSPSSLPVSLCACCFFFFFACKLARESRTKASIRLCCLDVVVRVPTSKNTAGVSVAHRPAGILPAGRSRISPGGTNSEPQKDVAAAEGRKEVGFHTLPLAPAAFSTYVCFFIRVSHIYISVKL